MRCDCFPHRPACNVIQYSMMATCNPHLIQQVGNISSRNAEVVPRLDHKLKQDQQVHLEGQVAKLVARCTAEQADEHIDAAEAALLEL